MSQEASRSCRRIYWINLWLLNLMANHPIISADTIYSVGNINAIESQLSSSSSSSSSSNNLSSLYCWPEDEREEFILQELARNSGFSPETTTLQSESSTSEEIGSDHKEEVDQTPKILSKNVSSSIQPTKSQTQVFAEKQHNMKDSIQYNQLDVVKQSAHFRTSKNSKVTKDADTTLVDKIEDAVEYLPKQGNKILYPEQKKMAQTKAPIIPTKVPVIPIASPDPPTASSSSSSQSGTSFVSPWVRQFLARCYCDVLLPVPRDFCSDNFNLSLLPPIIEEIAGGRSYRKQDRERCTYQYPDSKPYPLYRQALKLLVQDRPVHAPLDEALERATIALYLLLHQRFVLSPRGMDMIRRRFLTHGPSLFGRCPRLECRGAPLLPIGDSDQYYQSPAQYSQSNVECTDTSCDDRIDRDPVALAHSRAKRYCYSCRQVYFHWKSLVDGCAWGTTFCHLFLLVYGNEHLFTTSATDSSPLAATSAAPKAMTHCCRHNDHFKDKVISPYFEPRIFGFRLHPSAVQKFQYRY